MKAAADSSPDPRPSRRMFPWLVGLPAVLLLLAFAGAHWRVFHLAYCKRLFLSANEWDQVRGTYMLPRTHLRTGMSVEEVLGVLDPLPLRGPTDTVGQWNEPLTSYSLSPKSLQACLTLCFDRDGKLVLLMEGK